MSDLNRSKEDLINELTQLRKRNTELERFVMALKVYEDIDMLFSDSMIELKLMQRKHSELKHKHLEAILDAISSAVVLVDANKKIIYANRQAIEFYGLKYDRFEQYSHFPEFKVLRPDGTICPVDEMPLSFSLKLGQEVRNQEMLFKKDEYSPVPVLMSSSPLINSEGKVNAVIVIFEDITECKKIATALEEREILLRTVLENSNDGINMINLATNEYVYMNEALIELAGFSEPEMKKISLQERLERVHPDDRNLSLEFKRLVMEGTRQFHDIEYRWLTKNGEYRWVKDRRKIISRLDGIPKYVVGIVKDITEQKRSEEALWESDKKYRNLFNTMNEGFCIIEMIFDENEKPVDFMYVEINPAFEKILGIKNAVGKRIRDLKPNNEEYWYEIYGRVALTGEPVHFVEESREFNSWFFVNAFKVQAGNGRRVAVLFNDVTMETKAKKEMEKIIKTQDDIFANISHELKTPLNVIFSTIQLLELYSRNETLDDNKEKIGRYINTIKQNCYRFTKLINNIVDLSKIDSGFFKLNLVNENIVVVIENIVQSIAEYVKEKGLNIVFDTDVEEKIITFDPNKLERIMLNLISNAIKFSNPSGTIYVNVSDHTDYIGITVRDTGIGIDKENLDIIFGRFRQVDKTLTRNAEGSGIGLSLVKSIVDLHGGRINVESEIAKGSEFKIELPVKKIEIPEEDEKAIPITNRVEMINVEFSDIYAL